MEPCQQLDHARHDATVLPQELHRGGQLPLQVLEHEREMLLCLAGGDLSEGKYLQRDLRVGLTAHADAVVTGRTADDPLDRHREHPCRGSTCVDESAVDVPEHQAGRRHQEGVSVRSSAIRLSTTSRNEPPRSTTSRWRM